MQVLMDVDGRQVPWPVESRCRTCRSPRRAEAESLVAAGHGWVEVAERLLPGGGISAGSLRQHHLRGHAPVQEAVLRRLDLSERSDLERGVDGVVESAATTTAVHRLVARDVADRLARGELPVSVRDGLQAERGLIDLEQRAGEAEQALLRWQGAFGALISLVGEVVTDRPARAALMNRAARDPAIADLGLVLPEAS